MGSDGVGCIEGTAVSGVDIVNYQTLTSHIAQVSEIAAYAEGWATNGTLVLTDQGTFYAWSNWTPGEYSSNISWTNNGIILVNSSANGIYKITGTLGMSMSAGIETLHGHVFMSDNGGATNVIAKLGNESYMRDANDVYPFVLSGFIRLDAGDYLEIRFSNSDSAGKTITCHHINFNIHKIGD